MPGQSGQSSSVGPTLYVAVYQSPLADSDSLGVQATKYSPGCLCYTGKEDGNIISEAIFSRHTNIFHFSKRFHIIEIVKLSWSNPPSQWSNSGGQAVIISSGVSVGTLQRFKGARGKPGVKCGPKGCQRSPLTKRIPNWYHTWGLTDISKIRGFQWAP